MPILDPFLTDPQTLARAIGVMGFFIYVGGFFALCIGRLNSTQPLYFALVFTAAVCVLVSLWADFNLSAAMIQVFYILMSLGGLALRRRRPMVQTV